MAKEGSKYGSLSNPNSSGTMADHLFEAGSKVKCPAEMDKSTSWLNNHSLQHVDYDTMTTADDKMNDFSGS